jgi:hypothetical protein
LHSVPDASPVDGDPSVGEDLASSRAEVHQLREAMASRAPIEQAKGMLMLAFGLDEDRAFGTMVRWSSVHNVKIRVVAATMIDLARRDHALGLNAHSMESMVTASLRELREDRGANRTDV